MKNFFIFMCSCAFLFGQDKKSVDEKNHSFQDLLKIDRNTSLSETLELLDKKIIINFDDYLKKEQLSKNPFINTRNKLFLQIEYVFLSNLDKGCEVISLTIPLDKNLKKGKQNIDYEDKKHGKLQISFDYEIVSDKKIRISKLRYQKLDKIYIANHLYFDDEDITDFLKLEEIVLEKGVRNFLPDNQCNGLSSHGIFEGKKIIRWEAQIYHEKMILSFNYEEKVK